MKRIIFAVVPFILAVVTIILIKPSNEECRKVGIERLSTINLQVTPSDILINDYLLIKTLHYVHKGDTFKLGSGAFLQVRVNDKKLENIRQNIKQ